MKKVPERLTQGEKNKKKRIANMEMLIYHNETSPVVRIRIKRFNIIHGILKSLMALNAAHQFLVKLCHEIAENNNFSYFCKKRILS